MKPEQLCATTLSLFAAFLNRQISLRMTQSNCDSDSLAMLFRN